ncbi:alpha/beta fold hydrolase [Streptomyces kanamyceticus]|uniref:alpha/beta fold hydrolase n=1 Tax=Streptomyces kanamyceticus TaxID=1967 RepID=UPI0037DCD8FE
MAPASPNAGGLTPPQLPSAQASPSATGPPRSPHARGGGTRGGASRDPLKSQEGRVDSRTGRIQGECFLLHSAGLAAAAQGGEGAAEIQQHPPLGETEGVVLVAGVTAVVQALDGAQAVAVGDKGAAVLAEVTRASPSGVQVGGEPWPPAAWPDVPTKFIVCKDDRFFPPELFRGLARARLGIVPDEIGGGHCVALSRSKELADLLVGYLHGESPTEGDQCMARRWASTNT